MITRLVLVSTLGVLCSALGFTWSSAEFWCFLGLFWAMDILSHNEGFSEGLVHSQALLKQANLILDEAKKHNPDLGQDK